MTTSKRFVVWEVNRDDSGMPESYDLLPVGVDGLIDMLKPGVELHRDYAPAYGVAMGDTIDIQIRVVPKHELADPGNAT